jgi:hypothetical protein
MQTPFVEKRKQNQLRVPAFDGDIPKLWSYGVRDGDPVHTQEGALGALYYFSMEYLREKGYDMLHFGGSRAFLRDGVLQFKRKRGMQLVGLPKRGFQIRPLGGITESKDFFIRNPFIYEDNSLLRCAVFLDGGQPCDEEDIERIA